MQYETSGYALARRAHTSCRWRGASHRYASTSAMNMCLTWSIQLACYGTSRVVMRLRAGGGVENHRGWASALCIVVRESVSVCNVSKRAYMHMQIDLERPSLIV